MVVKAKLATSRYALVIWGGITEYGIRRTTLVMGRWVDGNYYAKRVDRNRKAVWKHDRAFTEAEVLDTFAEWPTDAQKKRVREKCWWVLESPRRKHPGMYID